MTEPVTILGIESSCDDTAAAVVTYAPNERAVVESNLVADQALLHAQFGGVVPEIAARAHAEKLDIVVAQALKAAGRNLSQMDAIAVTSGPGLIGGVLSGVMCAKGLAAGSGKPLIGVNHLAGHALTPRLTDGLAFPYLLLLVSGGHCQFLEVRGIDDYRRLGGTIDDAPGEAFDKTAKLLGLGYPGGPEIEKIAENGDPKRFKFPRPLTDRDDCNMSFSGLKTALRREVENLQNSQGGINAQDQSDLAAGFQRAVTDVLVDKSTKALRQTPDATGFAVAGGVAANKAIGQSLKELAEARDLDFIQPPMKFCTDNAAMIAFAGAELFLSGVKHDMRLMARPRWPLDQNAAPILGAGKKGAKA